MSVFSSPEFDDHQTVAFRNDPASGLRAIIAIHDTTLGPALGGTRFWPYASEADAEADVLRLSRGMTYKAALAGVPYGGGKAVIVGDPATDKSRALLTAMGRFVDSFGGGFVTGEDVGMTVADVDTMRTVTRHVRGTTSGSGNPAPKTAYGVFLGMTEAVRHRLERETLEGVRVAVQGIGNVGRYLCRNLADAGARLVVADLDAVRAASAAREFGARAVSIEDIHRIDCDVFAPCALGGILTREAVAEMTARIVAGSANNQLADEAVGEDLRRAGILYAPDYVINAGGLVDVASDEHDYDEASVYRRLARIPDVLSELFARAEREGLPTNAVADRMARERIAAAQVRSAQAA